jgi:hypothetical protein
MAKISFFLLACLLLSGCQSSGDKAADSEGEAPPVELQELPEAVRIDPQAREVLEGWPQYQALERRMPGLAEAQNEEELKLVLEELDQICQQLEENPIPEPFEQPSVRSRIKVLRTYLEKLEADLYYRLSYGGTMRELMESYNALGSQFNVIARNTLTPELFEDE